MSRLDFRRNQRLTDGHDTALGHTHQQTRTQHHCKCRGDTREKRADGKRQRRQDQQAFARARLVRDQADAERGNRPGERQRSGQYTHLGVVQVQIRLDERHEKIRRIPVEKHDAEIDTEQPCQHHLVARRAHRLIHSVRSNSAALPEPTIAPAKAVSRPSKSAFRLQTDAGGQFTIPL